MVASIDATVVGIALPAIGHSFRIGFASLQWVVTAYTVTLAGLLLGAGALGDRYGRRRVFLTGVVWFAVASTLCAIAPGPGALIAARVLQGIGAALLTPGSPAILEASFHPADRSRAIGAWSGLSGVGTAIGPFLGGWLVEAASWRLVFLINLPVAAAVVALSWRHVPESRALVATGRADLIGGALATVGLMGVTYALIEGASSGWVSPTVLAAFNGGAITLAVFLLRQPRVPRPLLPPNLFSSAQFSAVNRLTFIVYGALGGVLFLLPIDLQQVCGYTALEASTALLPVTVVTLALSARSGALAARIGPRLRTTLGPVTIGAGFALFTRVTASGDYLTRVLPAVAVFGLGLAITVAPLTATVLAAAPARYAGTTSAVNSDVARAAALIAVATLPAATGITGDDYLHPERFSAGFHAAAVIASVLCVLGGGCLPPQRSAIPGALRGQHPGIPGCTARSMPRRHPQCSPIRHTPSGPPNPGPTSDRPRAADTRNYRRDRGGTVT